MGRVVAPALLGASAMLALAGLVLLTTHRPGASATSAGAAGPAGVPAAVSTGFVCSLSNADASAALIQGADGGQSVTLGARSYWLFGDTLLLPTSGRQIQQNAIAWSDDAARGNCPNLKYQTSAGAAAPFIAKDGALTVWPSGAIAAGPAALDVFATYAYGSGPYAYWIGEVGVLRVDTSTMGATVINHRLFDAQSGFEDPVIGVEPIDIDSGGRERLVLTTKHADHLLARGRSAEVAVATAYEYWDGTGWSRDAAAAAPLWPHAHEEEPLPRLATFESGASIAYNPYLHEYIAVVNAGPDKIGARTATSPEGPWSAPTVWIDCLADAQPAVPVCYSPAQHAELSADGGRSLFITFTRMASYEVVAYRVRLAQRGAPESRRTEQ